MASSSSSAPGTSTATAEDGQSSPAMPSPSTSPPRATVTRTRTRGSSNASRRQNPSIIERFQESSIPSGMWSATGTTAAKAPTIGDIRRGSFSHEGWTPEGQSDRRRSSISSSGDELGRRLSRTGSMPQTPASITRDTRVSTGGFGEIRETIPEHEAAPAPSATAAPNGKAAGTNAMERESSDAAAATAAAGPGETYPNGYRFPPKHSWTESTIIGLKGFWRFFLTPFGFLLTVYGLNVVAWGGMLFLLLCNAAPAMCHPTCNDINSPRRIWIEIDSQILNALFCVTGFGLIPWRFRDFYYLLKWRVGKNESALRRLAGIHKSWFRLPNSDLLDVRSAVPVADTLDENNDDPAVPIPISKAPEPPLTGVRAPPTALWKMDYVIDLFVANTFLQAVLSAFMWGFNRYTRPSWSTGLFVALACIVAGMGGLMQFTEGKQVKKVEGVPISDADAAQLDRDDLEAAEKAKMPAAEQDAAVEADAEKKKGVGLGLFSREKHEDPVVV